MKAVFTFLLIVVASVSTSAQHFQEEELELSSKPDNLYGTLMIPDSNIGVVALIIPGSGPTDRNGNTPGASKNNSLKFLAQDLANLGIATLRIDKRGAGKSMSAVKSAEDLVFDDYIDDAINWGYKVLNDVRFNKLVVIGHSEGSLVAMKAIQELELDLDVLGFVSLAGAGYPIDEIILKQLHTMPDSIQEEAKYLFGKMKAEEPAEVKSPMLMALFNPSSQKYMMSWVALNPQEEIKKVNVPVLILNGTTDIQVAVDNAEVMYKARPTSEMVLIESMNHVFKKAPINREENLATYGQPDLQNVPELAQVIATFVKKHLD